MMLGDIVGNLCRQMLVVHANLCYCDTILFSRIHLRGWQQNGTRRRSGGWGQHPGGSARGEEKEQWGGAKSVMEESNYSTNSPAADGERESETTRWNTNTHTITVITVNIVNSTYKWPSNKLRVGYLYKFN